MKPINWPDKQTVTTELSEKERLVLTDMANELDMTESSVLRLALITFQMMHENRKDGWTVHWINADGEDKSQLRAREFIGEVC